MTARGKDRTRVAIVGRPNTGKSHVFSNLSAKYSVSGNYHFTTIETKSAVAAIETRECEIIDTPGLHSLFIHSEEEIVVRDLLFSGEIDVIVQCIDANRLKQSLTLTLDLIALGIPMVISLNAIDETVRRGTWIDSAGLSRYLGVPVVESMAVIGSGTRELKAAILKARPSRWKSDYGDLVEEGVSRIENKLPAACRFKRKTALLLLQDDCHIESYLKRTYGAESLLGVQKEAWSVKSQFRGSFYRHINNRRNQSVDRLVAKILHQHNVPRESNSQTLSRLSRHPVFGFPILLGIILLMFYLVVTVANGLASGMDRALWQPIELLVNDWVPQGAWNDFLIGEYGVLTLGVSTALLTVLPILSVFFLLFNILEDSGYIPSLCVLTKRVADRIGLTGNAILPITLAFGCKTMATMTTRSLRSRREKYIAIYLIAFGIPCAAQMALNISILGNMGLAAVAIVFAFLSAVWLATGFALNRILPKEPQANFIQELPAMRLPDPKAVLKKTGYKLRAFLEEALPVFIYAAVILFVADRVGILDALKSALKPVITGFLGFPLQMVDVLFLSMANRDAGVGLLIQVVRRGNLDYVQTLVAVTLTMMFVPCMANIMAMIKEIGAKSALPMIGIINVTAVAWAGLLNWLLLTFMAG